MIQIFRNVYVPHVHVAAAVSHTFLYFNLGHAASTSCARSEYRFRV